MIGMRWAIRGVGLVSTIILARLLTPEDFGVVAMAMVAVAILASFTQSGTDLALLRNTEATREHYDTAWTLEIIQSVPSYFLETENMTIVRGFLNTKIHQNS